MARWTKGNFNVDDGVPVPPKNDGRPRDPRIADICERATAGLACGQFKTSRDAARHFVSEYKGKALDMGDRVTVNQAVKDLQEMIDRHIDENSQRS